jgi:hypothetical protein
MSHAEKLERLKFDARQAMIEYGIACRKDDQEGIRASTTAAVAAIDALALLAQQPEAVGWQPIETAPKGGARQLKRDILYIVHKFAAMEPEKEGPGSDEEDESWNSWYVAAFDLMGSEIGDALDAALAAPEASEPAQALPQGGVDRSDEEVADAVSDIVGLSPGAWDTIHSSLIVQAFRKVLATPEAISASGAGVPVARELLHASVIQRIWKECKAQDLDLVAFAWKIQRAVESAAPVVGGKGEAL